MNEEIMLLCNTLVYNNKLKCGNESVANRRLALSKFPAAMPPCKNGIEADWLRLTVDPNKPVIFLDTDRIPRAKETGSRNKLEAEICMKVIETIVACGLDPTEIGVITPYRSQSSQIRRQLFRFTPELEVHTIDKYQGRDKSCIFISLVRSNLDRKVGNLLRDWRRINVAFTRAKSKLILGKNCRFRNPPGTL
mmetsp:Transcript_6497/g.8514  ORF Transcript_6497/g.8514 Transcript_6497/m.8514 type:complete len:193 (+) Transcript_6497:5-583(+)